MKTIRQAAELTGVSARTLQYYDEIGLLKPSGLTPSGYRLYNEDALQKLQQILFFKELGFKLKEIREILQNPGFDRTAAFKKQKELLLLKRSRTDRLIRLLDRLEKGEACMSFKEFDLSDYIAALEDFKLNNTGDVVKYWGSTENFERFIQKIRENEPEVARHAILQFGSTETYTEAMKSNLEHFSERMEEALTEEVQELGRRSDALYARLTADRSKDASSGEIQQIVREMHEFFQENAAVSLDRAFWNGIIHTYSNDYVKAGTDEKYGKGASDYIVKAFQAYLDKGHVPEILSDTEETSHELCDP